MGISNKLYWTTICSTLFLTQPAQAQMQMLSANTCEASNLVAQYLMQQYEEKPLAIGTALVYIVIADGSSVPTSGFWTIWTNQDSGSFTNTISFNDGITCILNTGIDFKPYTD